MQIYGKPFSGTWGRGVNGVYGSTKYCFPFANEARLEGEDPTNPGEPALFERREKVLGFLAAGMSAAADVSSWALILPTVNCRPGAALASPGDYDLRRH